MSDYEVEVEITLKVTIENVNAVSEEEAKTIAEKKVREDYERKITGITQIDTVEAVWVDEYED